LKVCREFDDVTSAGKLFHVRAMVICNAWSPTVDTGQSSRWNIQCQSRRWLQALSLTSSLGE